MNKVIVNQLGTDFLVPQEHASKFKRRNDLVLLASAIENAIPEVLDPTDLQVEFKKIMQKIRCINRTIPDGCAQVVRN
jgi:hypothetical protein